MPKYSRQLPQNPLVIIFLVDGARPDIFRELLDSGQLPHIQNEMLGQGTFRTAVSCCPSTTGPAYLPFLTGCFPGTMNIPGIRWLDKSRFYKRGFSLNKFRSYNGIEAGLFNRDMPQDRPTLHEIFERPYNIHSMITRGLRKGHNLAGSLKPLAYLYAHITDDWNLVDRLAYRNLMACLERNPDFIFAVFPGVDSFSHLNHPRHSRVIEAYKYVDFAVGKVVARLKSLNRWDETLLILTSDHGLTATARHLDLATYLENRNIKTMYYPIIWKRKPQAAVMISGNALGHIYWLNGDCNKWQELDSGMKNDIKADLVARDEIDMVISHPQENSILVDSCRGRARIILENGKFSYMPETGDPLGYGDISLSLNSNEALEATFNTDYPDTMVQLGQLFRSPRSGDLVVISKNGYDLRQAYEWPEHHASHGSLHREHMLVPLIYNQQGWDTKPARTTDIFNTVLEWAGKPIPSNTDGRSLL